MDCHVDFWLAVMHGMHISALNCFLVYLLLLAYATQYIWEASLGSKLGDTLHEASEGA